MFSVHRDENYHEGVGERDVDALRVVVEQALFEQIAEMKRNGCDLEEVLETNREGGWEPVEGATVETPFGTFTLDVHEIEVPEETLERLWDEA